MNLWCDKMIFFNCWPWTNLFSCKIQDVIEVGILVLPIRVLSEWVISLVFKFNWKKYYNSKVLFSFQIVNVISYRNRGPWDTLNSRSSLHVKIYLPAQMFYFFSFWEKDMCLYFLTTKITCHEIASFTKVHCI